MRDLTRETFPANPVNGHLTVPSVPVSEWPPVPEEPSAPSAERTEPVDLAPLLAQALARELAIARRDRAAAKMAGMILDTARLLEPLTRLIVARLLAALVVASEAGLAFAALRLTEGWERVAVVGACFVCLPWTVPVILGRTGPSKES